MTYTSEIERHGFAVLENCIDDHTRKLLENDLPLTRNLANSNSLRSIVEPVLGSGARVVRTIYFDKHRDANWKVAWHQDLTIAVREKIEVDGFRAWSTKAGITHVQPPVAVLAVECFTSNTPRSIYRPVSNGSRPHATESVIIRTFFNPTTEGVELWDATSDCWRALNSLHF